MRIFIITMEDPLYTLPMIKTITEARGQDIVGISLAKGNRLTIGQNRSKVAYVASLLLIMGLYPFLRNSAITLAYKAKKYFATRTSLVRMPGLAKCAEERGIPLYRISSPNSRDFLALLRSLDLDVIINQSQSILKKELLQIPRMGVINRHNALLPKNRGRLTPFWVLYKNEKETGVSIHFVNEGIDAGPIIVQERYPVLPGDNFHSLVEKNYKLAPRAMLKALDKLERGEKDYLDNCDASATYNPVPTLKDALEYRWARVKRGFQKAAKNPHRQELR